MPGERKAIKMPFSEVCKKCGKKCEDARCEALIELYRRFYECKRIENKETIKQLRPLLGIRDAEIDEETEKIANKLIQKRNELEVIINCDIQIGYVRSFEEKIKDGRIIFADCRKVNKVYGAYLPYDFIITLYEPNIALLSQEQINILIFHELQHIGVGERGLKIVPHDVEDFHSILDEHGTRWNEYNAEVTDITK